jgi:hypothetical protein
MNLLGSVGITSGWAVGASIGAVTGAFNAAINGGNILQGALIGAVQGGIAGGILHGWEEAVGTAATGIEKAGAIAKHVVGHGVVGGAANEAMGGKFQDGFLSAAASAAAVHTGLTSTASGSTGEAIGMAGRTAASAIIGGTASALGGGKFANGAYTAAFQHLLNTEVQNVKKGIVAVDEQAKRLLSQLEAAGPKMKSLFSKLNDSGHIIEVRVGKTGDGLGLIWPMSGKPEDMINATNGVGHSVKITTYDGPDVNSADGIKTSLTVLAHELGHAFDHVKGQVPYTQIKKTYGIHYEHNHAVEERAVRIENVARQELNLPIRKTYGGVPVKNHDKWIK